MRTDRSQIGVSKYGNTDSVTAKRISLLIAASTQSQVAALPQAVQALLRLTRISNRMVASAPPIGSKYAFSYVGGHTTDAARVKSLTGAGPLTIARDHVLALLLPDAWEVDATTGRVDISQNDVHEFIIPGAMFDPNVGRGGVHFAVRVARVAKLLVDVDHAGMDWAPVRGSAAEAVPIAVARFTAVMKSLSDEQRTIKSADVLYDEDEDAATGTWYDHVTPNSLMSGDGSPEVMMQFLALTPFCYVKDNDGGRSCSTFEATLTHMASSVGKDISSLAPQAQAAVVLRWFKASRPPMGMAAYIEDGTAEIERRAGVTQA